MYPVAPKISFMSYFEFLYGLRRKSPKNKQKARSFVGLFEIIDTTNKTAENLVMLKDNYGLSLTDLFIASQVLEEKGILVTMDKDFEKIGEIEKIVL